MSHFDDIDNSMSLIEFVQQVGAIHGVALTRYAAESVLWNHTGFPCFWPDATVSPLVNFRRQLDKFFEEER